MQLIGESVTHAKFGAGEILTEHDGKVTVLFAAPYGQKDFVSPDAFERFLRVEDEDLRAQLAQALCTKQSGVEAARRERLARIEQTRLDALAEKAQERSLRTRSRKAGTAPAKRGKKAQ